MDTNELKAHYDGSDVLLTKAGHDVGYVIGTPSEHVARRLVLGWNSVQMASDPEVVEFDGANLMALASQIHDSTKGAIAEHLFGIASLALKMREAGHSDFATKIAELGVKLIEAIDGSGDVKRHETSDGGVIEMQLLDPKVVERASGEMKPASCLTCKHSEPTETAGVINCTLPKKSSETKIGVGVKGPDNLIGIKTWPENIKADAISDCSGYEPIETT